MLEHSPSPKHILVDLLAIQCQLKILFPEPEYEAIVAFLTAKDYYNDYELAYPTLKEVEAGTRLKTASLRKLLLEMYDKVFKPETNLRLDFGKTEITFYLNNYKIYGQFVVNDLKHLPRVGEKVELPFVNAKINSKHFYVEKVDHTFENNTQKILLWLKSGFYNSYWELRKDEALLKGEISLNDEYALYDFQLKEKLGLPS